MANLGFQAVLGLVHGAHGAVCHRAFADRARTVEAGRTLAEYDVVALSLSFEGDYPAALAALAGAGIPLRAALRDGRHPLVLAGGVGPTLNPEPLAPFVDAVLLGEAEAGLDRLHRFLLEHRALPRPGLLAALADARQPGVYVPGRYAVDPSGGRTALGGAPDRVDRVWVPGPWEPARTRILAPDDALGGAYLLEVSRGCPHGCRFCAAGYLTRPSRFLPVDVLVPLARRAARDVGRVGFVGAAVSDHPGFASLARAVLDAGGGFSVSSFRAENLTPENVELLVRGGLRTLTVAIEAGTERLRRMLGKGLDAEDLLAAARLAGRAGLRAVRVYAMVGLPGETDQDVEALVDLAVRARAALGGGTVTLSVAPFVPKPHTPLQWEAMAPEPVLRRRLRLVRARCGRHKGVGATVEPPRAARLQGLLGRGGREVADLLERAVVSGDWRSPLRGPEAARILDRPLDPAEPVPWGFVGGTPGTGHLLRERAAALAGRPAAPCTPGPCRACEVCPPGAG